MTPGMKPGLATTLTRGARWLQETKQTTYWQTLLAVQKIRQRDSNLQPSGLKSDKLPVTLQEPCFIGILPLNISLCFGCALKVVFCTLTLWNSDKPGSAKKNSGSIFFWHTNLMKLRRAWLCKTRRRMARERWGAGSSVVSIETLYYKTIYWRCVIARRDKYIDTSLHCSLLIVFHTQNLLHTDAFTHRSFYTQKVLHTEGFTHRH